MFIILALIIAIASFNIISSLSLLVLNKQKDIAILISLGFSKNTIQSIFLVQGIIIGTIGVSFGVLLGVLLANNIKLMFHYPKGIVSNYCYNNMFMLTL